jgi:putative ATPase
MGHGEGYKYPHSFGGYVEQEYMKKKKKYYKP